MMVIASDPVVWIFTCPRFHFFRIRAAEVRLARAQVIARLSRESSITRLDLFKLGFRNVFDVQQSVVRRFTGANQFSQL